MQHHVFLSYKTWPVGLLLAIMGNVEWSLEGPIPQTHHTGQYVQLQGTFDFCVTRFSTLSMQILADIECFDRHLF